MGSLQVLLDEYSGDDDWADFASYYKLRLDDKSRQAARLLLPEDEDLAETVAGMLGLENLPEWLEYRSGVLEGNLPREVIASGPDGYKIVRHAIMRMPV